jgi:hypothetical protein
MLKKGKESIIVHISKKDEIQNAVIIEAYHVVQLRKKYLSLILLSRLTPNSHEFFKGIISFDFDATVQTLIMFSKFVK